MELCKSNWQLLTVARLQSKKKEERGSATWKLGGLKQLDRGRDTPTATRRWRTFTLRRKVKLVHCSMVNAQCRNTLHSTVARDSRRQMSINVGAAINSPGCNSCCARLRQNLIWFTAEPNFLACLHFRALPYFPRLLLETWTRQSKDGTWQRRECLTTLFTTTSVTLNCPS